MELRSGRRLCSTVRTPGHGLLDRISALTDDLLLLILARLLCVATAARTAVLSRRWRNLWTLLSTLVFRHVKYSSLEPALARLVSPTVSLIDIHVPEAGTSLLGSTRSASVYTWSPPQSRSHLAAVRRRAA
jgi:hypothetical protein